MRTLLAGVALTLMGGLAGAVAAEEIVITFENASKGAVSGADFYPLGKDGQPVEDNLGGFFDDLAPGASTKVRLSANRCGPLWVRINLVSRKQLVITLDTCNDRKVRVID